jgi:hypothetical protein
LLNNNLKYKVEHEADSGSKVVPKLNSSSSFFFFVDDMFRHPYLLDHRTCAGSDPVIIGTFTML